MRTTLLIALLASLLGTVHSDEKKEKPAKAVSIEIHVNGMSCHNCSDAVEDALLTVKGVEVKSVDAKSNLATVVFDPSKIDILKLVAAINATKEYTVAPTVSYNELEYENDGSFSHDGKPFTGTATDTHKKTGKQSKSYQFKEGKLHGLIREWYEDGTIGAKKFYKEGKRHGLTEYWDEKGKLTAQKKYVDDEHVEEEGETK